MRRDRSAAIVRSRTVTRRFASPGTCLSCGRACRRVRAPAVRAGAGRPAAACPLCQGRRRQHAGDAVYSVSPGG